VPGVPGSLDLSKVNLQLIDWDKVTPEGVKAYEARWNSSLARVDRLMPSVDHETQGVPAPRVVTA